MENFPQRLAHPNGVQLRLERDRVVVTVTDGPQASDALTGLGLVPERDVPTITASGSGATDPKRVINDSATRTWARSDDGSPVAAAAMADSQPSGVSAIGPVYIGDFDGEEIALGVRPDVLLVTPAGDRGEAIEALAEYGLEVDVERSEYLGNELFCRVAEPLVASSLDLAATVAQAEFVTSTRLEMMPVYRPHAYVPNDTMYGDQWNIRQIGAGGTGHTGWNDQRGDANIVIGVLDDGVDLGHPDLRFAGVGINLGTMQPDGNAGPGDNHGTACAGCAAAVIDNNEGVAGVAGGCSVLPIAFEAWSDTEVAAGIRYAARNGVHVLSMSFGWDAWDPAVIDPAIQEAYDAGVVMCVATHNYNRLGITYPATNPLVLACGASDQVDERKSPSSPDGERWGSNYGPQISVVAPGVLIPTTDRVGAAGYTNGNYTPNFNGTSSATPQVAGLAALLLSCNASLTPKEVRKHIETTAAKVGSTAYQPTGGKPNGTWNNRMGYGRIDVEAAIHRVCKSPFVLEFFGWDDRFVFVDFKFYMYKEREKDFMEEVKSFRVREIPDFGRFDEELVRPIDQVDGGGRPFINGADRAPVSDDLARGVRRRR